MLDKLMGTPPTPPPPDTATDLSQKAGEQPKTVRARLEQHRDKASCSMCHGVIDPTGLALENFDAIGRWRTTDAPGEGARSMPARCCRMESRSMVSWNCGRNWSSAPDDVRRGRDGEVDDVRASTASWNISTCLRCARSFVAAAKDNYKLSSIVLGIVNSDAFRKQAMSGPDDRMK